MSQLTCFLSLETLPLTSMESFWQVHDLWMALRFLLLYIMPLSLRRHLRNILRSEQDMCATVVLLPAGHAYAAAISACAVGSAWPRAVQLFDEMRAANIQPDVVSCTALISALGADGQWQRAETVIRWMHEVWAASLHALEVALQPRAEWKDV